MKHRLSYLIAQHAVAENKRRRESNELNYSELSRQTGCTVSSLWFYFNERRRWPADSWLKVLHELGAIQVGENSITIAIPNKAQWERNCKK